tara:strand:- start:76 stop:489 length:414 start_codon:yes stop_codon:yes gene_type:complete
MTTQLQSLAKRIPKSYIKTKPGGFAADYVSHADIQQMLLAKLGPCSQEITQIIRNAEGQVHGVVLRMVFNIDGETVVIDEIGECERPGQNDGLNAKMAVSDGTKRCASRIGLGLHLWAQDTYVLDKALATKEGDNNE